MANNGSSYNSNDTYFRQLSRYMDSGNQESVPRDNFVDALQNYREAAHRATTPNQQSRDDIWEGINLQISQLDEETSHEQTPVFQISSVWQRWALAASLLIIALGGLYLAQNFTVDNIIATTGQQMESVTLADGSTITLRPHSEIFSVSNTEKQHILRLHGEAWFEIEKNSERTIKILAGNGRVEVTGTRFMVSEWNKQVQVYLESGSINFERVEEEEAVESVTLQPGQYSEITPQQELLPPESREIEEYNDWLEQQLVFEARPLNYIFAELEQQYAINIEAPRKVLNDTLSGRILLDNRDSSLNELERVLPGRFEKTGDSTYQYIPE